VETAKHFCNVVEIWAGYFFNTTVWSQDHGLPGCAAALFCRYVSTFRRNLLLPWSSSEYVPTKRWYPSRLHIVTSQKTVSFILTTAQCYCAVGDMTQATAETGVSLKHQNTRSEWDGDCVFIAAKRMRSNCNTWETLSLHSWHGEDGTHSKVQNKCVQDKGSSSSFFGGGGLMTFTFFQILHSINLNEQEI
jgi:hypothetical protein